MDLKVQFCLVFNNDLIAENHNDNDEGFIYWCMT